MGFVLILLVSSVFASDPISVTGIDFATEAACRSAGDEARSTFAQNTKTVDVRYVCAARSK